MPAFTPYLKTTIMKKTFLLLLFAYSISNVQAQIITTIAGTGASGYAGDGGPATAALLSHVHGVVVDANGNVFFADNSTGRIRKIDYKGTITTVAGGGTPILPSIGDGGPATLASLHDPTDVEIDGAGNIYIADDESAGLIRKVDASGIITTFAGGGSGGDGIPATATALNLPYGVALDAAGNLYIADYSAHRVRKVDAITGIITTFAGTASFGYSGDGGPATAAVLMEPSGVTVDKSGNVYITDWGNFTVRKVNAFGIISTVAGTGTAGYSGDGGPATAATVGSVFGIVADAAGNIYFADASYNRLRMVNTSGTIFTIAGTGIAGYSGDGGLASAAKFNADRGLAIDCGGDLYIGDANNNRVRKITYTHAPYFIGESNALTICENSGPASIDGLLAAKDTDVAQTITWSVVVSPAHGSMGGLPYGMLTTGMTVTPTGLSYTPTTGFIGTDSFRVLVSYCGFLSDERTIYVVVNPLPVVGNINGIDTVCMGKAITFSDATTSGVWSATGGASVSATGTVTGTTAGAGTISYTVTTLGCSTAVGYAVTVVNCPNEVKPLTPEGEPAIWPNPVKDELMVSNAAGSEVRIYNVVGQQSFGGLMMTGDKQVVNIKGLASGTYIVRITGNGWAQNFRVVKE
jgi:sugar lactone lactonase YvrE